MSSINKIWNLVRYTALVLILWNIPSFFSAYFGIGLGSMASYASSGLLLVYFIFTKNRHELLFPFVLLGLFYFTISSLNYSGDFAKTLLKEFARFMIVVVCVVEALHRTTRKELYLILLIGALSVIVNAFVFPLANANFYPTYGRYSGFYLNPNFAGSICLAGFALSYAMSNRYLKIGGQLIFTLAGVLTFSRGFIVIWLLINIISIYNNRKNVTVPLIGAATLIIVIALSSILSLNRDRFSALQSIFASDTEIQTETLTEDSRTATWALYTDIIADRPIFGNGFGKMKEKTAVLPGVHNSYLMVWGEAGIIPFLLMLGIYAYLIIKSFRLFKTEPEYFYLACSLVLSLMVGHGYFDNFYNVVISMFVYIRVRQAKPDLNATLA